MKKALLYISLSLLSMACSINGSTDKSLGKDHIGTWRLVSKTTIIKDSVAFANLDSLKTIKILNEDHFAFFTHELPGGKDSTMITEPQFVSGAGSYTLKEKVYTEFLEYCNYREWENNSFTFNLEVKGDSLIQSGVEEIKELKINQIIVEKYIRVKE